MHQDRQSTVRDAALRRLSRINRVLIAASIIATGLLTDVAAHAFPGRTAKGASTTGARDSLKRSTSHSTHSSASPAKKTSSDSLQPPAQAPRATTESTPAEESESAKQEAAQAGASTQAGESTSASESTSATEPTQATQAQGSASAKESTSASEATTAQETSAPVVSGGS